MTVYGQETLATRTWLEGGEAFIRRRPRFASDGLPVPVQVQILESEFVPMLDADTWPGLPVGNRIRSGIELDNRGQRIAYWMYREHPGDFFTGTITNTMLIRVLASDVVHMYEPKRPGQLRGVSMLAPILTKLRDIGNYQDAVLLRQQIANLFVAFLTRKLGAEDDNDPLTGKPIEGTFDNPLAGMSPGIMQELEDGQDVKFANPPEAGTTYSDYLRTENMSVAAGGGLPYELHSGDIRQVSDRTLRIIINEFRRFAEQRQWQIVIPMFCQNVRNWWADAGLLVGKITADELDDVKRVEWATQGWAHIHPVQDPQGKVLEVNAGFRSRSSVIGERGDDPEQVDQERADDQQREEDLDLQPIATNPSVPLPGPEPEPAPPKKPDTKAAARAAQRKQMEANLLAARARRDAGDTGEDVQLSLADQEHLALQSRILDQLEALDDELQ
jgi:lambda family phage portal protein